VWQQSPQAQGNGQRTQLVECMRNIFGFLLVSVGVALVVASFSEAYEQRGWAALLELPDPSNLWAGTVGLLTAGASVMLARRAELIDLLLYALVLAMIAIVVHIVRVL
jgi:ascorbate-specific PTS system EIIC-type component UlaA